MKKPLFVTGMAFILVTFGYSKDADFYKEFRFRIERAAEEQVIFENTPPASIPKDSLIILESRNVNYKNGLGRGGWKKVYTMKSSFRPTERDVENIFFKSPASWIEDQYRASLAPTADRRQYWWANDGTLHFYALYKKLK
jgi:hypothetical protein